jgi:hypothetical protein
MATDWVSIVLCSKKSWLEARCNGLPRSQTRIGAVQ